jgi:anti-sigma-K factor RskA
VNPDIHTLAGAFALDAVDDVERAAFGRHMAECEACATEVAELRTAAARLSDVTAEAPPPALKNAVLAQIGRTRQVGPGRTADEGGAATRWRRWTAAAVAAAIIAVGAGTATFVVQEQRVRQERQQAAAVTSVLSAPDAVVRTATVDGGKVTVVLSPSLDRGVAVASGLPDPGIDHAYQFWVIKGNQPTSAGVLAAGASGGVTLFNGVRGAGAMALSKEPAHGSATPTDIRGTMPVV